MIMIVREVFMESGRKRRLGVLAAAAVLAGGPGTNAVKSRSKLIFMSGRLPRWMAW
jgi:hypothetical protein